MISFEVFHYVCLLRHIPLQLNLKDVLFSVAEAAGSGTNPIPHPLRHLAVAELLWATRSPSSALHTSSVHAGRSGDNGAQRPLPLPVTFGTLTIISRASVSEDEKWSIPEMALNRAVILL